MTSRTAPLSPERLIGVGFRGWLAGYQYQDVSCWEYVWNAYATTLGPKHAKSAVAELSGWLRQVNDSACRRIETYPTGCAGFCQDECIAISVIAACQNAYCPALRACAFALVGPSNIERMLAEAQDFADRLRAMDQCLSPNVICNVAAVADRSSTPPPN